jgi:anti-anti-sigma regulatory factor
MELKIEAIEEPNQTGVMSLAGDLDASNFQQVIAEAQKLFNGGVRHLLLDLTGLAFMSSSGLVALHSIAKIFRGEKPPDLEYGWAAIHAMGEENERGVEPNVKLINPQPKISSTLQKTGMDQFFQVFADRAEALGSFQA